MQLHISRGFASTCASLAICAASATPLVAQKTATVPLRPMTPVATPVVSGKQAPKATAADLGNHPTLNPNPSSTGTTSGTTTTPAAVPAAGIYSLALTATKLNGHAAGADHVMAQDVGVSWSGSTISIAGDGVAFSGQVSNNHLSATSHTSDGTITLSGTPAAHYASGTFSMHDAGNNTASGGFTLTPPSQQHTAKKLKPYGGTSASSCGAWCSFKKWWAGFTL